MPLTIITHGEGFEKRLIHTHTHTNITRKTLPCHSLLSPRHISQSHTTHAHPSHPSGSHPVSHTHISFIHLFSLPARHPRLRAQHMSEPSHAAAMWLGGGLQGGRLTGQPGPEPCGCPPQFAQGWLAEITRAAARGCGGVEPCHPHFLCTCHESHTPLPLRMLLFVF